MDVTSVGSLGEGSSMVSFGIGGVRECSGWMLCVRVGDEELRCRECAERLSEWEVFVKEKTRGNERRMWVVCDAVGEVAVGCVEDDGREVVVLRSEPDGERGTDAVAVEDDVLRRDVLRGEEPVERGVGVLLHGELGGMLADAAAEASVVEEQDVEANVVECECAGNCVGDGAVSAVEEERGGRGERGCVSGSRG